MVEYNQSSEEIQYLCNKDPILAKGIERVGKLSYTTSEEGLTFVVGLVISQMLSSKVAEVIEKRFQLLCNYNLTTETISSLEIAQMRSIGLSNRKAQTIKDVALYCQEHPSFFKELATCLDKEVISRLTSLKGIGPWTAKMYLIFALDRMDVLPYEDGAFLQAYRYLYKTEDLSISSITQRCAVWHPYASVASRYLYRMLDLGYTKEALQ
ncbi:3-methyladenine DNA glycosylase/8-oxoguanine DNA glycosylase [Sphaerochaeta pleomorpha str. Grapes]|uniref:DNA-3-methyladenine glycosylase II n=1 Tax=Sphaerochaeta pleomorpha (strain ATCC BAA-1885 / DSM 22778 / Grapes) TaxID=158190 RepID=G8QRF7_SPHPG|nr:DNA-3-methyladenine glycosylase [Sphaerochaeta pleomorpha]AEV28810.1 3-methyladenine DNA glycosylase/8-oxoguanine DNA glycosylase [Sphaerochaeta pleomorpha str. Grapes]